MVSWLFANRRDLRVRGFACDQRHSLRHPAYFVEQLRVLYYRILILIIREGYALTIPLLVVIPKCLVTHML